MLSRVAENLYWLARYVERADAVARLLDDAFLLELDAEAGGAGVPRPLENVLDILNGRAAFDADRGTDVPAAAVDRREAVLRFLTFSRAGGCSIRAMIAHARENARAAQEALGGEAWSQLNHFHLSLNRPRLEQRFLSAPGRILQRVKRECTLFAALVDETLPRTEAFHFLRAGRCLERVDMLGRILNVHCLALTPSTVPAGRDSEGVESAGGTWHWTSLLRSCSAYESYLRHARERVDAVKVLRYLLLEADFPRSMRSSVARCLESLRYVAGGGTGYGSEAERRLGRLDAELRYMDVEDLFAQGAGGFLIEVQDVCNAVGREVHQAFFRT